MTIWSFMPVVSGSCHIFAGSVPAMHAADSSTMPAAEPAVTSPASAPVSRAMTSPAFWLSSCRSINHRDASFIASTTAGGMMLPPYTVIQLAALMMRLTSSLL